jgi:hypothetical protein
MFLAEDSKKLFKNQQKNNDSSIHMEKSIPLAEKQIHSHPDDFHPMDAPFR